VNDFSHIDRPLRILGRVIGRILLASGVLLLVLGLLALRDSRDGCACAGGLGIGGILLLFGFLLTGLDTALGALRRKVRSRSLSKKLSAVLGSPTTPSDLAIRWLGSRNGTTVALSWSLDSPATQVAVQIAGGSPGTLRILPNVSRGGRLIGGRTIPTKHDEFDRTFLVRSEPTTLIGDLFVDARRDCVARALLDLPDGPSSRVILTLGDVRLRVSRVLRRLGDLERVIEAALVLAAAIAEAARRPGYSSISVGAGTSGRCLICVSTLESDIVLCIRCRTPHHKGCWDYTGECATFACGGRRWIPVQEVT
jgi:hypothetical protein